jgi:sodium-dependent dicarboxylate transporter 2/3/5
LSETEKTQQQPSEKPANANSGEFLWPEDRPEQPSRAGILLRPLPRDFPSWVRIILVAFGIVFALRIYLGPTPSGLSPAGQSAGAVFLICTVLWVTNVLPLGITGLLAIALLGLTGALTPADAFAAFGNSAVFFILGVFILAAALVRSGLSKRCALLLLSHFGRSPATFATGMMLTAALMTVFMPAQATAAMLFPIALEVTRAMQLRAGSSVYGKVLFLSLAWGAMVGSNASFLGSTRAALALGMLRKNYEVSITFATWMMAAVPLVILGAVAAAVILRFSFRHEAVDFSAARNVLQLSVAELGRARWNEWRVGFVMVITVFVWVFFGGRVDLAAIALVGACAMFVIGALKWEDLEGRIYWNVILMYGGAIALGVAIDRSGSAQWLIMRTFGDVALSPFVAIAGLAVFTLLLSEFMSNAAAVAVMLPLAFSIGDRLGVSPVTLVLTTSFAAGLDFALPISSAPNTIAFASGYLRISDFLRTGTIMTIASILILLAVVRFWWPLIGIN